MHRLAASFILGFHGCDQEVADALLGGEPFRESRNDYDWLGPGIYFWEANPQRGLDFAIEAAARKPRKRLKPAVVGAVIDLGVCLDLTTQSGAEYVALAHDSLLSTLKAQGIEPPRNHEDGLRRRLDCAVVTRLHEVLAHEGFALDTVRGVFVEGEPIYPTSGFHRKTHIQIAVCNPDCIKGVFRVPEAQLERPAS